MRVGGDVAHEGLVNLADVGEKSNPLPPGKTRRLFVALRLRSLAFGAVRNLARFPASVALMPPPMICRPSRFAHLHVLRPAPARPTRPHATRTKQHRHNSLLSL